MAMPEMAEMRAFEALAKNERLADLVALCRAVAEPAAEARAADWRAPEEVKRLAAERGLGGPDVAADVGEVLQLLERGATSAEGQALASALWAHAVAEAHPRSTEDEDHLARVILWLAARTPFDATRLLDRALGDEAAELWAAIGERVRRIDLGTAPDASRGEALLGAAALATSASPAAKKLSGALAAEVKDPALARLLGGDPGGAGADVEGELRYAPRGVALATLLAVSGALSVMHVFRLVARVALAYRRPVRVTFARDGVRIRSRTEILGRNLRVRDVVVAREGLASVAREVRYPRAALYTGLFFLALGSFVGVHTLAEGVAAASPTMLLAGLAFVALGLALDLALGTLLPGAVGRCRLFIVPAKGAAVCVADVDAARADAALARLTPVS
jgi:hypothetical protein